MRVCSEGLSRHRREQAPEEHRHGRGDREAEHEPVKLVDRELAPEDPRAAREHDQDHRDRPEELRRGIVVRVAGRHVEHRRADEQHRGVDGVHDQPALAGDERRVRHGVVAVEVVEQVRQRGPAMVGIPGEPPDQRVVHGRRGPALRRGLLDATRDGVDADLGEAPPGERIGCRRAPRRARRRS
jgi:hypothetical protein